MSLTLVMNDFVGDAAFAGFDQACPVKKGREWKTDIKSSETWSEQVNQIVSRPRRHWYINWELLDKAARDKLIEIFDAPRGMGDSFLWLDDDEYLASDILIVADGVKNSYQLKCTYRSGQSYEWEENKYDIVPGGTYAPVVSHNVDGAQTEVESSPGANQFTLDDTTGLLTWAAGHEPSAGILTVTFEYYFRVRWASDFFTDIKNYPRLYQGQDLHIVEKVRY
jgi:uncharacterized protein (TIGR02217 family)